MMLKSGNKRFLVLLLFFVLMLFQTSSVYSEDISLYDIVENNCNKAVNLITVTNESEWVSVVESLDDMTVTSNFKFQYLTYWNIFKPCKYEAPSCTVTRYLVNSIGDDITKVRLYIDVKEAGDYRESRVYEFDIVDTKVNNMRIIETGSF